ncbi:uncharacterized protein zgc:162331 [Pangasianodon hypophthalmus]|uniref:uncharacterized protein zgc:162331 n=1 Tax=Pangasianodon hypophthalmus TaxID=310915 RepID=UPI00230832A1|nr:uncharacterized protein zgc:162331 [Pangasianodon hypophthalmus]
MERDWRRAGRLWFLFMSSMWTLASSLTSTGTPSLSPTDASEEKESTNNSVTPTNNCTAIMKPEDHGFQVAILASVISCIVILVMSLSFIICYLQERHKRRESISSSLLKKRNKRQCRLRSDYWLERSWDAPPKIYHLPQHLESCLCCNSHPHMIRLDGYENHGCQRSQESLMNDPLPGLYHTESQLYPLQRVPSLTAPSFPTSSSIPVYLHFSTPTLTSSLPAQPVTPTFHKFSTTPPLWLY